MKVRNSITLLFAALVVIILSLVCGSVYFFAYTSRISNIKKRLTNRALTSARLLSRSESFDKDLIRKIDSSTSLVLQRKTVQAFDAKNRPVYSFTDLPGDSIIVDTALLDATRVKQQVYFTLGQRDVVASYVTSTPVRLLMLVSAVDTDGREKLQRLRLIIVFSFAGGLLIAIAAGHLFSGRLLLPIKRIADELNEISTKNLTGRIDEGKAHDEWTYLSATLNNLLSRLQDSFEVQQRFIANASHELFTPLASISSQLEVSLLKQRVAEDYRKTMESIYHDVRQLNKLTHTLLEFASASGHPAGLVIDLVRIDEILLRLPAAISKINAAYSLVLEFDDLPPEENSLLAWGNEDLLLSAFTNIASNGCKYSPDHKAHIHLRSEQETIVVSIRDNGPGIAAEEASRIFQPFYRIKTAGAQTGFGLGLSLSNRIIKLHKGSIGVDSSDGHGSRFLIRIPMAAQFKV